MEDAQNLQKGTLEDEANLAEELHGVRTQLIIRTARELESIHEWVDRSCAGDAEAMTQLAETAHQLAGTAGVFDLLDVAAQATAMGLVVKSLKRQRLARDPLELRQVERELERAVQAQIAALMAAG